MKPTPKKPSEKTQPNPQWNLETDGITQSLLCKFLICRHRFWIRTVLGLAPDEGFSHRMEYGSMLHAGFEAFAAAKQAGKKFSEAVGDGCTGILTYAKYLKAKHPKADIPFWVKIGCEQFELYCTFWRKQDEKRKYIFQEEVFAVPIELPSGRTVTFRGKYDEGFVQHGKNVLQENKCKGEIDEIGISTSLHSDLQTMSYLTCLNLSGRLGKGYCRDLLYNVILRPNGGRFPLRIKKAETEAEFATRIMDKARDNPMETFKRWNVEFQPGDMRLFEQTMLFPILEQLCDWWDSIKENPLDPWNSYRNKTGIKPNHFHYQRPFGVFDNLALGNRGDYFDFLVSGGKNKVGLTQSALFQELTNPSLAEKQHGVRPSRVVR